jgi:hypothetical protein
MEIAYKILRRSTRITRIFNRAMQPGTFETQRKSGLEMAADLLDDRTIVSLIVRDSIAV